MFDGQNRQGAVKAYGRRGTLHQEAMSSSGMPQPQAREFDLILSATVVHIGPVANMWFYKFKLVIWVNSIPLFLPGFFSVSFKLHTIEILVRDECCARIL